MIEEQKETLELISIIMSDIYKNMSPKEIENFFNATILDMIDKKDLAMQESTIEDEPDQTRGINLHDLDDIYKKFINIEPADAAPDIQTYGIQTDNLHDGKIQPRKYRLRDNYNWYQAQKIHTDQTLNYNEKIMDLVIDGPTYTIHYPYGEDATIRNLALEEKKKIKNPNPNFEHLLNKKKKRKNKGIK